MDNLNFDLLLWGVPSKGIRLGDRKTEQNPIAGIRYNVSGNLAKFPSEIQTSCVKEHKEAPTLFKTLLVLQLDRFLGMDLKISHLILNV